IIPTTFIPHLSASIFYELTADKKRSKLLKILIMISPIFLRTTGILLRDAWIMFSYLLMYYSLIYKKGFNIIISILITGWLRVTDLVTLFISTFLFLAIRKEWGKKILLLFLIIISFIIFNDLFLMNLERTSLS